MALQKSFTFPNGATGDYIRVGPYRHDRTTRECSAYLQLFASAATATSHPDQPLVPCLAKLRLEGAKFDAWVSNAALAVSGLTVVGALYEAAKTEPLNPGMGLTTADLDLADAENV